MTPNAATQLNVMVVFYSRYGATERLALAGGLGAIQARGNLRLRRLADLADASQIAQDLAWSANLQRMTPEYIAPRPIDLEWADVVMLAAPEACPEMAAFLAALAKPVVAKVAAVITPWKTLCGAAAEAGFQVITADPCPAPARQADYTALNAFGKSVCEQARLRK